MANSIRSNVVITLPVKDVRYIWTRYIDCSNYHTCCSDYNSYLHIRQVEASEMSRRFAQVKAVVFQINGFQEVITRHMRKDYTVSKPMDGGIRMGAKTLPYYGDENDYGSDGKLPYYWGDVQGETIKEYLERNK